MSDDTLYETHRDALHGLLCAEDLKESGLPAHDIARALGLSGEDTSALLAAAEHEEAVQMDLEHEPPLWISTSRLPPAVVPPGATQRGGESSGMQGGTLLLAAIVALAVLGGVGLYSLGSSETSETTVTSPEALEPSPPGAVPGTTREERIEERAEAIQAGGEVKRLQKEAADLQVRMKAWKEAADEAECPTKWSAGDTCYLTGRVMSQSAYQREAAELALRAAEIATLLERYRGQPPTSAE